MFILVLACLACPGRGSPGRGSPAQFSNRHLQSVLIVLCQKPQKPNGDDYPRSHPNGDQNSKTVLATLLLAFNQAWYIHPIGANEFLTGTRRLAALTRMCSSLAPTNRSCWMQQATPTLSRRLLSVPVMKDDDLLGVSAVNDDDVCLTFPGGCQRTEQVKLRYTSSDWWQNMLMLRKSVILRRIRNHLIFNTSVAVVVAALWLMGIKLTIPYVVNALSGAVLSLLLVFRTNAAYDRWWEARKAWGKVYAVSRNFVRMASTYISDRQSLHRICSALCAFPELMRLALTRRPPDLQIPAVMATCASASMCRADTDTVLCADRNALACCRVLGSAVHEAFAKPMQFSNSSDLASAAHAAVQLGVQRQNLESQVTELSDLLGICERILNAPVPYSYSRHTSRFLTVWLSGVPFGLAPLVPPLWLPFICCLMSWMFLSVEEIGHVIEEPFNIPGATLSTPLHPRSILNMEIISDNIVCDVLSAVPDHPARLVSRDFEFKEDGPIGLDE